MTTREKNILIAEFMGARYYPPSKEYELYGVFDFIEDGENEQHHFTPNQMLFSTSWDWLMPVVEKISRITLDLPTNATFADDIQDTLKSFLIEANIEGVNQTAVQFIQWYNKQPKV